MKKEPAKGRKGEDGYKEEINDYKNYLLKSFDEGSGWIQNSSDLWEGLYGANSILRGF